MLCVCVRGTHHRRLKHALPKQRATHHHLYSKRSEVFCCFAQSVASTRWMIQDELRIQVCWV